MLVFIKSIFWGAVFLVGTYFLFKAYMFNIKKVAASKLPSIIRWTFIIILVVFTLLVLLYGGMMFWTVFEGAWGAIQ